MVEQLELDCDASPSCFCRGKMHQRATAGGQGKTRGQPHFLPGIGRRGSERRSQLGGRAHEKGASTADHDLRSERPASRTRQATRNHEKYLRAEPCRPPWPLARRSRAVPRINRPSIPTPSLQSQQFSTTQVSVVLAEGILRDGAASDASLQGRRSLLRSWTLSSF